MSGLKIARAFELPLEAVTQTFAILAKRGAGKSYTASVMVEEMLDKNLHAVVLDPLGVWWGLQSSSDGKKPGYPITVLGGDHGDLPLEPTAGETIADFVVKEKQSVVIDLSHFRKADQIRFATAFCERLYQINRLPLHLVVDEADLFAPQASPKGHEARVLGAMEDLSRRGRARGIGMTLVTQRSAVLNKNVLTQIEVLIVMRTTSPQDRKAIRAWVDVHGEEEQWHEMDEALPRLDVGTAYLWSPGWLDEFRRIGIRKRRTFDSSATPKVGEVRIEPTKRAKPDLKALEERIADTIEEAKRNDPAELRKEIRRLEDTVSKLETRKPETVETTVEVPVFPRVLKDSIRDMLEQHMATVGRMADTAEGQAKSMIDSLDANFSLALEIQEDAPRPPSKVVQPPPRNTSKVVRPQYPPPAEPDNADPYVNLKAGETKMLTVAAQHHPLRLTRVQVGTLAGFTARGGTFRNYLGTLKRNGLIVEENKMIAVTEAGFEALGGNVPEPPRTVEERTEVWRSSLKSGERAMLDHLLALNGNWISRAELGEATGFTSSGGTFRNYLGTLRRNGLADVNGSDVRAGEALYAGL